MKQIRIAWNIGVKKQEGYGEWHPESHKPLLDSYVTSMNRSYGEGTHWIEESSPRPINSEGGGTPIPT